MLRSKVRLIACCENLVRSPPLLGRPPLPGSGTTLVIDETDRDLADAVADAGMQPVNLPTIMKEPGVAAALARACQQQLGADYG